MLTIIVLIVGLCICGSWSELQSDDCFTVPNECPNSNITFHLYTRDILNGTELPVDDPDVLNRLIPNPCLNVKFLIHGFGASKNDKFNQEVRSALLQLKSMYVISVDWSPITIKPCRDTSAYNTRVVGNCTGKFIDTLIEKTKVTLKDVHVIGFSLGAQATGFISRNMNAGKLVHITGLDPTLPNFPPEDKTNRLGPDSADFVDVYHTASGTRSQPAPCGTIDTYFNGGPASQPGCAQLDQNEANPNICSHYRSPDFYTESINTKTGFYGASCVYQNRLPLSNCLPVFTKLVGYHVAYGSSGVFGVHTNAAPPYAEGFLGQGKHY